MFLGEIHDNPDHHRRQAEIVAALSPSAVVFEMLTPDRARAVTPDARATAATLAAATAWNDSGWPDFAMYYPIFDAASEASIIGADVPRGLIQSAVSSGAAQVFGASAPLFGLDTPLETKEQTVREDGQQDAHCGKMPAEFLPGMVEAQRLRDASLARAAIAGLAEGDGPVVVITGNGHARTDWGAPALLATARPDLSIVSLAQFESPPEKDQPFDLWALSAPVERADPCAIFE